MSDRNLRVRLLLEGLDKMTKPLRDVANASSSARTALTQTQKTLKKLGDTQRDIGSFRELKSGLKSTEAAMGAARAKVADLARQMAAVENPTKRLQADFARAKREAAALSNKHQHQSRELQQLRSRLDAAGVSTRNLVAGERHIRQEITRTTAEMQRQERQMERAARARRNSEKLTEVSGKATTAGAAMIGAGVATAAPVALAVKQAMTLESAMADVRKVVDFPTPQAFSQMSNDILDMSTRIPMAAEGIAQIVAAAGRANVPRKELLRFAEDAAKMGVAFDSTAEEAGEMMAKWRTGFGIGQDEVVALADQINALTNAYGGNVGAVTEMVTRIGPLGKVAGLAAPQIAAMGQLLSIVGVESEIGATGIKNMMLALTKGEAATKSQSAAFKALGLDAVQVAKDMQKDAGGTILKVMDSLRKLPKESQAGMLTQLFGSESVAAIAPMLTGLDQLKTNFAMVGDQAQYAGSMNKEYLAAIAKTEGATGLAGNALSALNITMGQALLPTVVEVANKVRGIANAVRGWAREHPQLAKGIMVFLAGGAALLILLGGLGLAFAALTAAAAPLGIALLPLLLIVAAVAAVAAAAYMIYANWGGIVAWFSGIWNGILARINGAVAAIKSISLVDIGRNLILGLIRGITSMLSALKSTIVSAASAAGNWFKEKLGIHSPSRVFAQYGGFMMEGLEGGIAAGQSAPIERVKGLAADITRAVALGTAAPAIAATPAARPAQAPAMAPMGPVTIVIQQQPGQSNADLARMVRAELEALKRQERSAARSTFSDDQDYGGFA